MIEIHEEPASVRGSTIFKTSIPSDLSLKTSLSLRIVSKLIEEGLLNEQLRDRYEVCFEEAAINCIVHGNGSRPELRVTVEISADDDDWFVAITDQGRGFTQDRIPAPDDPDFPLRDSGRGVHLIHHLAERMVFFSGGRTLVISGRRAVDLEPAGDPSTGDEQPRPCLEINEVSNVLVAKPFAGGGTGNFATAIENLTSTLNSSSDAYVVLDLSDTPYLTSSGIGSVVGLFKTCTRLGHSFAIAGISTELKAVFAMMGLHRVFSIHDTVGEAMCAAESPAANS